jgi:hypothetical protein
MRRSSSDGQRGFVESFEQAWAEGPMNFDRRTDDALGEVIGARELGGSVTLWLIHFGGP